MLLLSHLSGQKFSPKTSTCVLVGYPPHIKSYKLYELFTTRIFISRDVIFHENEFHFLEVTHQRPIGSSPYDYFSMSSLEDLLFFIMEVATSTEATHQEKLHVFLLTT